MMPNKVAVSFPHNFKPKEYFVFSYYFLTRVLEKNNTQIVTPKDGLNFFSHLHSKI